MSTYMGSRGAGRHCFRPCHNSHLDLQLGSWFHPHYLPVFRYWYVFHQKIVPNIFTFLVCWCASGTSSPPLKSRNRCFAVIPIFLACKGFCDSILRFNYRNTVLSTFLDFKGVYKHHNNRQEPFLFHNCAFFLPVDGHGIRVWYLQHFGTVS